MKIRPFSGVFIFSASLAVCATTQAQLRNATNVSDVARPQAIRTDALVPAAFNTPAPEDRPDPRDQSSLFYFEKIGLRYPNTPEVTLQNIVTETVQPQKGWDTLKLPASFDPVVSWAIERKKPVAVAGIPRLIRSNGQYIRLKQYETIVRETPVAMKTSGARSYKANSALSAGNWFKIAVRANGVYKADRGFMAQLGVDPAAIDMNNIRLLGNGGQMLFESNLIIPNDDLVENPIKVFDFNSNGRFDDGDYFLFYATGPDGKSKDSTSKAFKARKNLYDTQSYYFLSFDQGSGKRITTTSVSGSPTATVNTFDDFQYHELDSLNLARFGKDWWGEELSNNPGKSLSRTFGFNVPNLDGAATARLATRFGVISPSGTSGMSVFVNGQNVSNETYGPVGGNYYDPVIAAKVTTSNFQASGNQVTVTLNMSPGSSVALGYLDRLELQTRRQLTMSGVNTMIFRDWNAVGNNLVQYNIANAPSGLTVWDITNPLNPQEMQLSNGSFIQEGMRLHEFVAFNGNEFIAPEFVGRVNTQNLHATGKVDFVVVTHPAFLAEAQRLANYHNTQNGLVPAVATTTQIYNEFSSGSQDISAIRDFLKMLYDRAPDSASAPKFLLLMGDASYDYLSRVPNNNNFVPTYQTPESIIKTQGYCTDDFFGFLDDNEDLNNYGIANALDVGVGRLPVNSSTEANDVIDKIINYESPAAFGPWRTNMTYVADDVDRTFGSGLWFMDDDEAVIAVAKTKAPQFNVNKIYGDAYTIESTPAGARQPEINQTINNQIFNGTFVMNYIGHGGELGWAAERILTLADIKSWNNPNKLPLLVTATCEFSRFDNPNLTSAGEMLLTRAKGGAIALMTTTQLVFQDANLEMNKNYFQKAFSPISGAIYPTLGDAYMLSKNIKYINPIAESTAANYRKFALLGDPVLKLSFPKLRVRLDSINGKNIALNPDTLKALGKYELSGTVVDENNNPVTNYSGVVYPAIYDKKRSVSTLVNYPGFGPKSFDIQNSIIYRGKATVTNGKFSFTCIIPKDITYNLGNGRLSMYVQNNSVDGAGVNDSVKVGGTADNVPADNAGPQINAWLNNEKFVNGGSTNPNPLLLLKLKDENGINTAGNAVGHDLVAILDNNASQTYVLNDFYEGALDDYTSGAVRFPLQDLAAGNHTMKIRAWDTYNNASETTIDFIVVNQDKMALTHVYNYPNPFTTRTSFMFEHNFPNQNLYMTLQVFTVSGKIVKSIKRIINTPGTRVDDIEWDGLDDYGDKLGRGVYMYKITVKSASGQAASQYQKLVLL